MKHSLSSIFNQNGAEKRRSDEDENHRQSVQEIPVSRIKPNQYQPRSVFNEEKIRELAETIHSHGVIQPIVLRPVGDQYEIIAGERRWRAILSLGWDRIPAIVKDLDDHESASMALIENLQREELTAIEEAMAYERLMDIHGLTQEMLAVQLGKGQSTIANKMRLLKLPSAVQSAILEKKITERHARAMIALKNPEKQERLLQEIVDKKLNVKETESRVAQLLHQTNVRPAEKKAKRKRVSLSKDTRIALNTIRQSIKMVSDTGMKVNKEEADLGDCYQITIRIPK